MIFQCVNLALLLKDTMELSDLCSGGALFLNDQSMLEAKPRQMIQTVQTWRTIDEFY